MKNIFFTQAEKEAESELVTLEPKQRSRQNAKQWIANEEPPSLRISVKEFTRIDGNTALYSMNGIKANAQIRVKNDVDLVLKHFNLMILGQPLDEVLITKEPRHKHYNSNEDRIILKDSLPFGKYFGDTESIKYY